VRHYVSKLQALREIHNYYRNETIAVMLLNKVFGLFISGA